MLDSSGFIRLTHWTGRLRAAMIVVFPLLALSVVPASAQVPVACTISGATYTSFTGSYTQNFDTLSNSTTPSSVLPDSWCFSETGTNANSTYSVDFGTVTTGNTYSYGTTSATDRAFGNLASGSLESTIGAGFLNNTGSPISALRFGFRAEIWRYGAVGRADLRNFQYSVNATTINDGVATWVDFDPMDINVTIPANETTGAKVGNQAPNFTTFTSIDLTTISVAAGSTFFIRWIDTNITGSDDGIGVDNFTMDTLVPSNFPPTITGALADTIAIDQPTTATGNTLTYTIGDVETPVNSLTFTATSSNAAVLPNANIVTGGTGASRTLDFTTTGVGYTNVTVTVTDGNSASTSVVLNLASSAANGAGLVYLTRAAEASTGVWVGGNYAIIADDEDQQLRLYDFTSSGPDADETLVSFDYTSALGLTDLNGGVPREVDLEASGVDAIGGGSIYWIGSHSNAAGGNDRPNRERIFRTDVTGSGATTTLTFGGYYPYLEDDLIAWDSGNGHGLGANYFGFAASAADGIAPEAPDGSGFNIEGFSFSPGSTVSYIAFRAPIVPAAARTNALVIPIFNLPSLIGAAAGSATFGTPLQWDLGGRGIRSFDCTASGCVILAGSPTSANDFRLYTWSLITGDLPQERSANLSSIAGLGSPEGILTALPDSVSDTSIVTFLGDSGDTVWYGDGQLAGDLSTINHRKFYVSGIAIGSVVGVSEPIVSPCPTPLNVAFNTAGSANVSATDTDSIVNSAVITSAAVSGITLDSVVAAGADGGTLTAVLNVANTTAAGTYPVTISFGNNDGQTTDCIINVTVDAIRIYQIQGARHNALTQGGGVPGGVNVVNVRGVVTGYNQTAFTPTARYGFFIQDETGDSNNTTSDGIFVFTNTDDPRTSGGVQVSIGDRVTVSGTVSEFGTAPNLTVTQIGGTLTVNILANSVTLPAPVEIGSSAVCGTTFRQPPTENIDDDNFTSYDPVTDGVDFYEALESMRVCVSDGRVVGPTVAFGTTREIWIVPNNGGFTTGSNTRGGITIRPTDYNPERVQIDSVMLGLLGLGNFPNVNVGTTFPGAITGVLYYSFSNYELIASQALPTAAGTPVTPETTPLTGTGNNYSLGTYNVENLDPSDGTFGTHATNIVLNLGAPDIVMLQEVQDDTGATNDGTVSADTTYTTLINAIVTAGGPTYTFTQVNPVNNADGGEPGGNIRVGFLYDSSRVTFVSGTAGGSTDANSVVCTAGAPSLTFNPGRIDPTNGAFSSSRKPLVAQFLINGQTFFIVNNHFNSKGGDDPLFGSVQPPVLSSEAQRTQQATIVRNFVQSLLACDGNANVIVAGDLNDFQFSTPIQTLAGAPLNIMNLNSPELERYGYIFQGNSQALDQMLVSQNIIDTLSPIYDAVHINAEFANAVSDHDPSMLQITVPAVGVSADLLLTKTGPTGDLNVGNAAVYTLNLFNDGPTAATNVTIVDTIPAGLNINTASLPAACTASGQVVTCTFASVPVSASPTPAVTITINATAATAGAIAANSAQVTTSDIADPDSTPNDGTGDDFATSAAFTVLSADLSLTKTGPTTSVDVGDAAVYTVNLFNAGPNASANVTVVDTVPANLTIDTTALPAECTASGQIVTCTYASVPVSASPTPAISITIVTTATIPGAIDANTAEVTTSGTFDPDSTPNDGVGDDFVTVMGFNVPSADLSLTKTGPVADVNVGDAVQFTISVFNEGPDAAANVTIVDTVPNGLTIDTATLSAGCSASGQVITCTTTSISVSASPTPAITITFNAMTTSAAVGNVLQNTAQVTDADTFDPDSMPNDGAGDDFATAAGFSVNPNSLTITKSFSPTTIDANGSSLLTFTITNPAGNGTLTGVAFSDDLPSGLTFDNTYPSTTICPTGVIAYPDADSMTFTSGVVDAGLSNCTVTVRVLPNGAAFGTLTNLSSSVTSDGGISSETGASAQITVNAPLEITPEITEVITPEVTPEVTEMVTPEVTPEVTEVVTPEVTPVTPIPPRPPSAPAATFAPAVTFLCDTLSPRTNGAITGAGSVGNILVNGVRGDTFCRIIVQNSAAITSLAEVGNASLISLNIVQAVDVFGLLPSGAPVVPFISPVNVCLRGSGAVYFLSASNRSTPIGLTPISSPAGYVCASVPNAGTVVLTGQAANPSVATPTPARGASSESSGGELELSDCQVTTTYLARLRSTPDTVSDANVIASVPYQTTLTATAYTPGWYRVIYSSTQGYISETLVSADDGC